MIDNESKDVDPEQGDETQDHGDEPITEDDATPDDELPEPS